MYKYVVRRLLYAVPTMFIVVTLIFFVMRVMPGDPAAEILGEYATEETLKELREQLGLNRPLIEQYLAFLYEMASGEFGDSIFTGESVAGLIAEVFPFTLELTITGILVGSLIGIPLGVYSALHRNTFLDHVGRIFALSGLSMPIFFMGVLLLLVFAVQLQWFDVISGISSDTLGSRLQNLVLPSLTIGMVQAAFLMRITRSSMLEVISQDYIRTARSKGLAEKIVSYKHALKNALLPVVTVLGLYVGTIIGGAVLTETVFTRPGLGKVLADAVLSRDYPVIQVALIIFSLLVVLVNLLTDLAYALLDPRIKVE
jgi:ABC-type dipeptide/oligopeptide/nickel transport system permease component